MFVLEVRKDNKIICKKELQGVAEIRIGRNPDNDVVLSDGEAGREHARLFIKGRRFIIEDMGSKNGTTLNGRKIKKKRFRPGDLIRIGSQVLVLAEVGDKNLNKRGARPGLRVLNGEQRGLVWEIKEGTNLVGRSEKAHFLLKENAISLEHAAVIRDEKGVIYVKDMESRNGTRVNDQPCIDRKVLHEGDVVRFAHVQCRFTEDMSAGIVKLTRTHIAALVCAGICVFGPIIFWAAYRPNTQNVADEANGLMANGRYADAIARLEEALKAIRGGAGKTQLIALRDQARNLLDAENYMGDLHAAISNKKWRTICGISQKLADFESPLSAKADENRNRKVIVARWRQMSDAYVNAERSLLNGDAEGARLAFARIAGNTNDWHPDLIELYCKADVEREGKLLCAQAEKAIREGKPREAQTLLDRVSQYAALSTEKKRELRKNAEFLTSASEFLEKTKTLSRNGSFDLVEAASFPAPAGESEDVLLIAHRKMDEEFAVVKRTAISFGSRLKEISLARSQWNNMGFPKSEMLFNRWEDGVKLAREGVNLREEARELYGSLKTQDQYRWMSGGTVEKELKELQANIEEKLGEWERQLINFGARRYMEEGGRDAVLAFKLAIMLNPPIGRDVFPKTGKSFEETIKSLETDIKKKSSQLYNEGYMLQYGSSERLRKMKAVAQIGLPYDQSVRGAMEEVEREQRSGIK